MSEVIKSTGYRELSHVVKTNNGNYYMVDSNDTPDRGYETMIFTWDEQEDEVESYMDIFCEWHESYSQMQERHYYIIEHLEEFV